MAQTPSSKPFLVAALLLSFILAGDIIDVTSASHSHPRDVAHKHVPHRGETTPAENSFRDLTTVVDCPSRHFYSEVDMVCKPCSACPVNQIIRSPCTARENTLCGPFFEFDKFHQSASRVQEETGRQEGNRKAEDPHHNKPPHHNSVGEGSASDLTSVELNQADSNQWRTLSYALIIVLSVICCLVVVTGLYVCVMCRRGLTNHKQIGIIRQPELLVVTSYPDPDPEPRYVDMSYVTSRDRLRTSRHLPVYQQIYTGSDTLEFPPLTSLSGDVMKDDVTFEVDHDLYVNSPAVSANEP